MSSDLERYQRLLTPFVKRAVATANGAAGGTTIVAIQLPAIGEFGLGEVTGDWNDAQVLILTGDMRDQLRRVMTWVQLTGTLTVDHRFNNPNVSLLSANVLAAAVIIPVVDASVFSAGEAYIWDALNAETVTITLVDTVLNQLTIAAPGLVNPYTVAAGAAISMSPRILLGTQFLIECSAKQTSGAVVLVSGQTVKISGEVVQISGQHIYQESGAVVLVSGQTVIAKISGDTVIAKVSGEAVKVSGETVIGKVSGEVVQVSGQHIYQESGAVVQVSGQTVSLASGATVQVSGDTVIAKVSGEVVKISGEVVQISGQHVFVENISGAVIEIGGLVVEISGDIVQLASGTGPVGISGQVVKISGEAVKVSGETIIGKVSGETVISKVSGETVIGKVSGEIVGIAPPTEVKTGPEQAIPSTSGGVVLYSGAVLNVNMRSVPENSGNIYIGGAVNRPYSGFGFRLYPGEAKSIDIDDFNRIYLFATVSGEIVTFMGVV